MDLYRCVSNREIPDGLLRCRWDYNSWHLKHSHDFWEFQVVFTHPYTNLLNNKEYVVQVKQGLLISPRHIHSLLPSESRTDYHLNIVIGNDFFKEICDMFSPDLYNKFLNSDPKPVQLSNSKSEDLRNYVNLIEMMELKGAPDHKIYESKKSLLLYIVSLIYISYYVETDNYLSVINMFIHKVSLPQNFRLSVEELVKSTNYSYSYFAKLFKKHTGISINTFIIKKKLEYASFELVRNLSVNINGLSEFLGFESTSYFITLFKKHFGVSPLKYRERSLGISR